MPAWWTREDDRRGVPPTVTEHMNDTPDHYVRTVMTVNALGQRWQLVIRDYQRTGLTTMDKPLKRRGVR